MDIDREKVCLQKGYIKYFRNLLSNRKSGTNLTAFNSLYPLEPRKNLIIEHFDSIRDYIKLSS